MRTAEALLKGKDLEISRLQAAAGGVRSPGVGSPKQSESEQLGEELRSIIEGLETQLTEAVRESHAA